MKIIWINNGKYMYISYKQKVYNFFLYLDNTEDTENYMDTNNDFENKNIFGMIGLLGT